MNDIVAAIMSALIVGVFSLAGVIITARTSQSKMHSELEKSQAVTNTEIKELTREVREHNDFAKRIPVIEEQIKVINHRIDDLEEKG